MCREAARYSSKLLLYFSYNGCMYNGSAHHPRSKWIRPVAKVLQQHLEKFFSPHRRLSQLGVSSRTDRDVHAIANSGSLLHSGRVDYNPALLRLLTNASLSAAGECLRLHLIREVPLDFSAVTQVSLRSYAYRLSLVTDGAFAQLSSQPAMLSNSCWLLPPPLDLQLLHSAAELVSGQHDFAGFTNLSGLRSVYNTNKDLRVEVVTDAGREPLLLLSDNCAAGCCLRQLELRYTAHSFLYKMLRFLTGALVAVAKSQLTLRQLERVLDSPSEFLAAKPFDAAPGYGLYLRSVLYDNSRHCLSAEAVRSDNASLDADFCRLVLNRFKDCRGSFDVAELTKEHDEFAAAKQTAAVQL